MFEASSNHIAHDGSVPWQCTIVLTFWARVKLMLGGGLLLSYDPASGLDIGRVVWRLPVTPGLTRRALPVKVP